MQKEKYVIQWKECKRQGGFLLALALCRTAFTILITGSCISNQPNWQPVHFACARGQKVVLRELIENYGVDPHTEDQVGCMVLVNKTKTCGLSRHLD